jgi:hypothetical protein
LFRARNGAALGSGPYIDQGNPDVKRYFDQAFTKRLPCRCCVQGNLSVVPGLVQGNLDVGLDPVQGSSDVKVRPDGTGVLCTTFFSGLAIGDEPCNYRYRVHCSPSSQTL